MTSMESAFFFECENDSLLGIIAAPGKPQDTGVVIVVGGPQYRIGSHRQFALLARRLAQAGVATLRFDYRGMGDSTGHQRDYTDISVDIRCAIDALLIRMPELRSVVLWGLCDGASAVCLYAASDSRVTGVVLANPWIRTPASEARVYLSEYYARRLMERDFWRKVGRGAWRAGPAMRSLATHLLALASGSKSLDRKAVGSSQSLPKQITDALGRFSGPLLILLSGEDFVAREFERFTQTAMWLNSVRGKQLSRVDLMGANHTFATTLWRNEVAERTIEWIASAHQEREQILTPT